MSVCPATLNSTNIYCRSFYGFIIAPLNSASCLSCSLYGSITGICRTYTHTQLHTDAFKSSNKFAHAVTIESTVLILYSLPTYYSILSVELWAIKLAIDYFHMKQCCLVYSFSHKCTAFWSVIRSYDPMLGHTQNIRIFSTTVRLHCRKYGSLLSSFEKQFSKTILLRSFNPFLLFTILGRGCDSGGEMLKLRRKVIM